MAHHNITGSIGEMVAEDFLRQKGFEIVSKNYRKPYGEIDIVSREKTGKYRFIEVKTVSWETSRGEPETVSHETHRPEENVHPAKVRRLMNVIQAYVLSHKVEDWQFDVIAVYLDQKSKQAKVRHLENVILGS